MYRTLKAKREPSTERSFKMARRKSYQKGNVQWHNNQWTLRYYLLDHDTNEYKLKRESEALRHCIDRNNKKAALRAAESFMVDINEQNNNPRKRLERLTFKAFIEGRWAAYTVNEKTQPSTLAVYNSMIKSHFLPFFGNMLMRDVTPATITQFFKEFRKKSPESSYAENLYRLLSSIFSVATQYDDISNNPVRSKLHKPKPEDREKPTLPLQVHAALINTVDPDYRVLFTLMSVAGLRIGEALALRWMNLDFATGRISITNNLWRRSLKSPKSKASKRTFRLPSALVNALIVHKSNSAFTSLTDFVFCGSSGDPLYPDRLRKEVLYPALDKLGIERTAREYGFHILRHTVASLGYDLTKDSIGVQNALGHADEIITKNIYIHISQEQASSVIEAVANKILGESSNLLAQESQSVN
jgi:integrase